MSSIRRSSRHGPGGILPVLALLTAMACTSSDSQGSPALTQDTRLLARLDQLEARLDALEIAAVPGAIAEDPLAALLEQRLARLEGDLLELSERVQTAIDERLNELQADLRDVLELCSPQALSAALRELLVEELAERSGLAVEAVLEHVLEDAAEEEPTDEETAGEEKLDEMGLGQETAQGERAAETYRSGSQTWTIEPVPEMVGRLGLFQVHYPEDVHGGSTQTILSQGTAEEPGPALKSFWGGQTVEVFPGRYLVSVKGILFPQVEVRANCVTRLVPGSLRVRVGGNTQWIVRVPGEKEAIHSAWGESEIGLPAGEYEVTVLGCAERLSVRSGECTVW